MLFFSKDESLLKPRVGFWSLLEVFSLVVVSKAKVPDKQTQDKKDTFFSLIFMSICAEGQEMYLKCIHAAMSFSKTGMTKLSTRNDFLPSDPGHPVT